MAFTKSFRFQVNLFDDALKVVCRLLSTCGCICFIHYIILHIFLIVKRFFSHSGGISRRKGLKIPRINLHTGSSLVCGIKSIVKGIIVRLMIIPFLFYTENFFYEMVHLGIENAQILCYIIVRKRLKYFDRCKEDNNGISKTDKRSNLLLVTRTYS